MQIRRLSAMVIMSGLLALGAAGVQADTIVSAGSGYWTNGATWSGGIVPGGGDDVTILTNHTVTITGLTERFLHSLTVNGGGILKHGDNSAAQDHTIKLDIVADLTIAANGAINVAGLGYDRDNGPGRGLSDRGAGGYGLKGGKQ